MRCGQGAHDPEKPVLDPDRGWEPVFGQDHAQTESKRTAMNVLIYLVPMALGLGLAGLFAFLWALKSGQYSDVDGAALRVLSDDDIEETPRR
jgi:cbb3-type cytochrome oxidase maturation protein